MFGGLAMMIGMMLFWVVLIAIGFYLLHRFINDRKEELSPMEILKVRLAKGEITLDEFEQISKKYSKIQHFYVILYTGNAIYNSSPYFNLYR
ncbi:hypothetical protein B1689_15075 [Geobacillus sp. 44C]|nr:hypothetical protein B1689_15075 [Geobacillus sp. 44C]